MLIFVVTALQCALEGREAKDLNCSSLILKIKDTVFAGDCLYQYWPDELKNNLNYSRNSI